ncbi:MAG: hypothetical protein NDJ90_04205, partial [Oligoflexia bacterium]|nr:hypothetical protein [Oligoflexia bacterium]
MKPVEGLIHQPRPLLRAIALLALLGLLAAGAPALATGPNERDLQLSQAENKSPAWSVIYGHEPFLQELSEFISQNEKTVCENQIVIQPPRTTPFRHSSGRTELLLQVNECKAGELNFAYSPRPGIPESCSENRGMSKDLMDMMKLALRPCALVAAQTAGLSP